MTISHSTPPKAPAEVRGRSWTRGDSIRTGVALSTVAVGGWVARRGVPELEATLFEGINGLPDWLYPAVWPAMQAGSLVGGLALVGALAYKTRNLKVGAAGVAGVMTAWGLAKVVKDLVDRGRPFGEGLEAHIRDDAAYGLGYVSGHAAVAFAVAALAAPHLDQRVRGVVFLLAAVVGFARIYSGAHLPLDVVGGAALGVLAGEAGRLAEVRWRRRPG